MIPPLGLAVVAGAIVASVASAIRTRRMLRELEEGRQSFVQAMIEAAGPSMTDDKRAQLAALEAQLNQRRRARAGAMRWVWVACGLPLFIVLVMWWLMSRG